MIDKTSSLAINKNDILLFLTSLFVFLPSNISSLHGLGSLIVMANNVVIGLIILNFLYRLRRSYQTFQKPSKICVLCVLFFVIRIILVYWHGGSYNLHHWSSIIKTIVCIVWFEWKANKFDKNRRIIMYAFWFWVIADAIVTFIWPEGSPLLNNGYLLGWKNNKFEFLFIGNLLALIEIQRNKYTIKKHFFLLYSCFAFLTIAMSYVANSGTTLLIVILLTLYIPFTKMLRFTKKFPSPRFILIFHIVLWCSVILNLNGTSIVGTLIEQFTTRDATFTGRIYIWSAAIYLILKAPITGYVSGFLAYGTKYILNGPLTGLPWEMAHNQILELFMQGGVILFGLFASVLLCSLYKNRCSLSSMRLARWALFSLMFAYLTEAYLESRTFIILIIIYYTSEWCQQDKTKERTKKS